MTNLIRNWIAFQNDDKYVENFSLNSNKISKDIFPNISNHTIEEEIFFEANQILGQKRKINFKEIINKPKKPNTKYSCDNMKRACKHLVIESAREFINKKIFEEYNGDIGEGIFIKKLLTLNQKQKKNSKAEFNKVFINRTLKDILSEKITKRIKYHQEDHNERVIEKILKEKKDKFEGLFNITFIECLEHFIEIKQHDELKGLTIFSDCKNKIMNKYEEDGENYYQNLEVFLKGFKERVNNSKLKNKRKTNIKVSS